MANLTPTLKCMCTITLFILFLLSYTVSSSSSSSPSSSRYSTLAEIQHRNPSPTITPSQHYQMFYLKNTPHTTPLTKQERLKKRRTRRNKNMMRHRKKIVSKNMHQSRDSQRFSVMLPKGYVPPSGSSPCHNDQPNTVSSSFHCHLSTTAQP
ncbi:hypothetical protein LR48_Vigan09g224500 [Vigna angularis]|uniref:Transmembrane protein n=2 Tax=Phaseolus angularis TaxID=3914 RepID=A0A0L9VEV2_PHAAN|nr:uncharacterized protein HKW66_Vig0067580 [Vigna angularis]KOM53586.1 hypothetical protein LR48_Vigan09g224500 [Vigna angularis]BAT87298.1 hypothetical protein VIGAN_05065300 [Vigna angularis var. angularis]